MMEHTEEQKKVFNFVQFESNHGIIDAVAGSGKTTTIVDSAAFIDPAKNVLFCAFNRSIRKEIQNRFSDKGLNRISVKTMHALGYDILKSNTSAEYDMNNNKYREIIKSFVEEEFSEYLLPLLKLNNIPQEPQGYLEESQLRNYLYFYKSTLQDINNKFRLTLAKDSFENFHKMVLHFNIFGPQKTKSKTFEQELRYFYDANSHILQKGNELAAKQHLIDYSDMLYLPFHFKLFPDTKYDLLFIDECQDLSNSQIAVALKYVKQSGRILSVGDPSQSIYGFAGADIHSYRSLKSIPNTVELSLSRCFRCPDKVIELAQNFREDIYPFRPKEGTIERIPFEMAFKYVKPGNLVISRTKEPLTELLFILILENLPVEVHEDEVKDIINDMRFLFTYEERRVRNFLQIILTARQRNSSFINKNAKKIDDPEERAAFIRQETDLLNKKMDFIKSQAVQHDHVENLEQLFNKIKRLISGGKHAVKLSTIHRAKGLENETVFILNFDTLPLYRDGQQEWEKEQERNLKYVALTRTKRHLYLVDSKRIPGSEVDKSLFESLNWQQ